MEKILVLRGGALGDFIITLPALALLRERWPAAEIELAGNATTAQLAVSRGLIDNVHSQHEARWAELFDPAPLEAEFGRWLASFDLIVSYWPDPEGETARHFPLRRDQQFRSAPAMPARAPAAAHYCAPLLEWGIEPRKYYFELAPLPDVGPRTVAGKGIFPPLTRRTAKRDAIAVHPGSGSPRKNWPAENWLRLIEGLPAPVSVILGEAELATWSALGATPSGGRLAWRGRDGHDPAALRAVYGRDAHATSDVGANAEMQPPLDVLINRPLEELVNHFAACRLFLGHDSGISHLAAACGAKCVLLFGPTEPDLWAPPAPNVHVLRRGCDPSSLSVDAVRRAVVEALADRK